MQEINLPTSPRYCLALNKKGNRCGKFAMLNSKYCQTHSPEYLKQNAEGLSKAHAALREKYKIAGNTQIDSIDDMIKAQAYILGKMYKKARESALNTKEIQSFATIGRSWIKAKMEQEKLTRLKDLEDRTKSLGK